MKNILIVNNNMEIGGVQKSLYNLLWSIHNQYAVTLCLFSATGVYADQIPPNVKVITAKGLFRYLGVSQAQCRGFHKLVRGILAATAKLLGRNVAMKLVLAGEKPLPEHYDCAIAFLHNGNIKNFYGGVQEFVLKKAHADQKIAFLHCDYGKCGANHPVNNRLIARFDRIAACSDGCRQAFEAILPKLKNKCVTVRNFHRFEEIRTLARQEQLTYPGQGPHIVMVSRLAHEKGIERAIAAVAAVKHQGLPMTLHIVGSGPMEPLLREQAQALQIEKHVIFHGQQSNPYPYMAGADLFLMTSFHEAAPMVIEEAISLGIPVLSTLTTSSREMVEQADAGWVCKNDPNSLQDSLMYLLANPLLLTEKKNTLARRAMNNTSAQTQFLQLIEGYHGQN